MFCAFWEFDLCLHVLSSFVHLMMKHAQKDFQSGSVQLLVGYSCIYNIYSANVHV